MKKLRITVIIAITMITAFLGTVWHINTTFASVDSSQIQSLLNTKMTQSGYKPGGAPPSSYQKGSGCYGFCDMLCRYLFGHALPSQASNHYSFTNYSTNFTQVGSTLTIASGNLNASSLKSLFMQAKPGDVIQMDYTKSDGGDSLHTMMVYSVSDSGVVFYHAGSSKVYFGGLWTTNGSTMTWNSFLSWLKNSDDGISVYRSKQSATTPVPSGTWITTNCTSSTTNKDNVTISWGASNASSYSLQINRSGSVYKSSTDMGSATSYTNSFPEGDYTAYITPKNSLGQTGPAASVNFHVNKYDIAPTIADFRISYTGYNNCEVSATVTNEGNGVEFYWINTNEGSTFDPKKFSPKRINRIGNTLSSYIYTADSQQYYIEIGYSHGNGYVVLADCVYTHHLPSYNASASYGNHTYYLYDHKYTRADAHGFAVNHGGNLVSINSAEEQKVISNLIKQGSTKAYYTGGYRNSDNTWFWRDNSTFSYTNWFSGQPDNAGGSQDALIVYSDGWDDDSANYKNVYGFIMEVVNTNVPISSASVSKISDQMYTGSPVKPSVKVVYNSKTLVKGTDYTVSYSNNTEAGTATVKITGKGDYTGTKSVTFKIVKYTWKQIDKKWYYIDNNGKKATGFKNVDGIIYYFDSTGAMQTGWTQISGKWYYMNKSGAVQTGWQQISKKWYYFDNSGVMQTGLKSIGDTKYYFNDSGVMQTGWQKISDNWYYFDKSGAMMTGWQKISKKWYFFSTKGVMSTGLKTIDGKKYYFDDNGSMITGWKKLSEKWYWFKSDGCMAISETLTISGKNYKFNSKGVCTNP